MNQPVSTYRPSEKLAFSHATDSGRTGSKNADAYLIFPSTGSVDRKKRLDEPIWYALLADGIGNEAKGRIASQLAVEVIYKELIEAAVDDEDEILYHLEAAFQQANAEIRRTASDDGALENMAAAVVAAAVAQNRLYLAYAGACSAYLVRHGQAAQLTLDAPGSLYRPERIAELFDKSGSVSLAQLQLHSLLGLQEEVEVNSYLLNAEQQLQQLGQQPSSLVDYLELQTNDLVLLCSSGLSSILSNEDVANVVRQTPVEEVADQLIAYARGRGVDENATVLVMEWRGGALAAKPASVRQLAKLPLLLIGLILLVGIFLAYNSSIFVQMGSLPSTFFYLQRQPLPTEVEQADGAGSMAAITSEASPNEEETGENSGESEALSEADSAAFVISNTLQLSETVSSMVNNLSFETVPAADAVPTSSEDEATPTIITSSLEDDSALEDDASSLPTATAEATLVPTQLNTPTVSPTAQATATPVATEPPTATPTQSSTPMPQATSTPPPTATPVLGLAPTATSPGQAALPTATATEVGEPIAASDGVTSTVDQFGAVQEIYILKKDDNLWSISFARGLTVEDLLAANPQIRDKNQVLQPGMAIIIPIKPAAP